MKSRILNTAAALCLCLSAAPPPHASATPGASASDWPQWRGPGRDGVSRESGLLKEWPAGGPRLLWQANDIGDGFSTPAVVGSRVYLMSNRGLENEFVQALSTQDGKVVWTTRVGNVGNPNQQPSYPKARSTPTVDGELLYALGSDGDLACLETKTGKVRWQKNLRKEFGGQPGEWAYADGRLYAHNVNGDFSLVEATPEGFRERGRFTPPAQPKHKQEGQFAEMAFAYPVIAGGRLYIRDLGTLWAYDIKAGR